MTDRDIDSDGATAPARPTFPVQRPRPEPPSRPPVTRDLAPPGPRTTPPLPPALRTSVWLWLASFLAGIVGLLAMARDLDALRLALRAAALEQDPSASAELLDSSVTAVLRGVFIGSGALIAVSAVCLVFLLRRRSEARWLLTVSGLLSLIAGLVDAGIVTGGAEIDRVAFLVQAAAIVLALITLLVRSSRAWFTAPRR